MCTCCALTLPRLGMPDLANSGMPGALSNAPAPPGLAAVWFRYNPSEPHSALIREAKYGNRPALARRLGAMFAAELAIDRPSALEAVDVLLPVPMHWFKQLRRGYNQSEEVARGIADVCGAEIADNLRAVRSHATQTRRSRQGRLHNLQGTIECIHPDELAGLNVCLVDDIVTTGATLTECIAALRRARALPSTIGALALAAPL